MSKGVPAIVWLIVGVVFGIITLVVAGVGGYFTWTTHDKVKIAERNDTEEAAELAQLQKKNHLAPAEEKRFQELNAETRRKKNADDINEWRQKRQYSIVALVSSLIPLLISLRCLFTGGMGFIRKPKSDDEDDDRPRKKKKAGADDDEEEERPVKKKKKKVDDDE